MHIVKPLVGGGRFYPYAIDQSCRFYSVDSTCVYRHPSDNITGGEEWKKQTVSMWVKLGRLTTSPTQGLFGNYGSASNWGYIGLRSVDELVVYEWLNPTDYGKIYKAKFRDPTAWYHICVILDVTQAIASDRLKTYVNGVQLIDTYTDYGDPPLNHNSRLSYGDGNLYRQMVGKMLSDAGSFFFDGYIAECNLVGGQDVTVDDFGQWKDGIWMPKKYTGSYGTNGFYLDFADSADPGKDVSGNGNHFTNYNLTTDDQVLDSPTNNFCTLNPAEFRQSTNITIADGALVTSQLANNDWMSVFGTWTLESGKWYWEVDVTSLGLSTGMMVGVTAAVDKRIVCNDYPGISGTLSGSYQSDGRHWLNGSSTNEWSTYTTGDIIGVALNLDELILSFYKNNVYQGNLALTAEDQGYVPTIAFYYSNCTATCNFGQHGFTYTPPTGYKALCSENLPEPIIIDGSEGMDVVIWTGDGASSRSITDLSFEPGMVWAKDRDSTVAHRLMDAVRGANLNMYPDVNNPEDDVTTDTGNGGLGTVLSNGFTIVSGTSSCDALNANGHDFVAWCLREAQKYGFDMVGYTGNGVAGNAIAHGLGGVPEFMIVKDRDVAQNWAVFHRHALTKADPETDLGYLDLTNVWTDSAAPWNDTAPTATQFSVGSGITNTNGHNYIAYLFRSISGFSKVFSYTGNGVTDGPVIFCGFKPKFTLIKRTDAVNSWLLQDSARSPSNPIDVYLLADNSQAEVTSSHLDYQANGFKLVSTAAAWNASGGLYVGIAFADNPFKYANAR